MKKLLIVALAFIAIQATAQERNERPNKERGSKMEKFQDFTPDEMATLQTKRMTLHLDLNESQQKEIQKINLENAKDRKSMRETRVAQKESNNFQKPSKEEHLKMMNARLDRKIEMKTKMKKILNEEQYAKWEKSQAQMSYKFEKGFKNRYPKK